MSTGSVRATASLRAELHRLEEDARASYSRIVKEIAPSGKKRDATLGILLGMRLPKGPLRDAWNEELEERVRHEEDRLGVELHARYGFSGFTTQATSMQNAYALGWTEPDIMAASSYNELAAEIAAVDHTMMDPRFLGYMESKG